MRANRLDFWSGTPLHITCFLSVNLKYDVVISRCICPDQGSRFRALGWESLIITTYFLDRVALLIGSPRQRSRSFSWPHFQDDCLTYLTTVPHLAKRITHLKTTFLSSLLQWENKLKSKWFHLSRLTLKSSFRIFFLLVVFPCFFFLRYISTLFQGSCFSVRYSCKIVVVELPAQLSSSSRIIIVDLFNTKERIPACVHMPNLQANNRGLGNQADMRVPNLIPKSILYCPLPSSKQANPGKARVCTDHRSGETLAR